MSHSHIQDDHDQHDHEHEKGHEHGHGHSHIHGHYHGEKNIAFAFFLNLIFIVIEVIGGLATNSFAILSDALHDLGDTLSLGISWYLERVAKKGKDARFSLGYRRFSLLAALINSLILMIGSIFILIEVIPRLIHPHHTDANGMFWLAIIGIAAHGVAAYRLSKGNSLNEKAVSLHLMEDVIGWIAVLFASILISIKDLHIIDPLLSTLITLYILWKVVLNLKETLIIFLQGVPPDIKINHLQKKILKLKGVAVMCDTNIWSLDGANNVLTTHITVENTVKGEKVFALKKQIKKIIESYDIKHITIELERKSERKPAELKSDVFKKNTEAHNKMTEVIQTLIPKTFKAKVLVGIIFLCLLAIVFFAAPSSEEHGHDENNPETHQEQSLDDHHDE
jgi:cobalt-zinc-cadmium efflux system protein